MPSLLALLISDRAIVDAHTRQVSLINLADILNVNSSEPLPAKASTRVDWTVYVFWHNTLEDIGRTFVQRLGLVYPDGQRGGTHDTTFTVENIVKSNLINFTQMPVGQEGTYYFEISLRPEASDESAFEMYARHPMTVVHNITPPPDAEPTTTEDSDPAI